MPASLARPVAAEWLGGALVTAAALLEAACGLAAAAAQYPPAMLRGLKAWIEGVCAEAAKPGITAGVAYARGNSQSFITKPGPFVELVSEAIAEITGRRPELSTSGGTSDARFIASYCPVIEFGLVGQTMHQIDERVPVVDLEKLTQVYRGILARYFG